MPIDLIKAIQQAGVFPSLFQRTGLQPKKPSFVEMAASYAAPSSLFKWQGQKQDYSPVIPDASSPALPQVIERGSPGPGSFAPIDPYAAQNREYERERARVEAMVKANPDMQKQAIADERAKVRDQGMAIWAAANPTLAKQVKPGAVGYDAIQRGIGIQELPSLENRAEFTWNQATQGPTPAVPMADAMLNPAGPGFIGGEGAPPVNFADPRFKNLSPEKFQELLNQYTKR
jgi:hypothetical protein